MSNSLFTVQKNRHGNKPLTCTACGLYRGKRHAKLTASGGFAKGILNIGFAPTPQDDATKTHWRGSEGRYLKTLYKSLGIDLEKDCLNMYAVNCATTTVSKYQIDCCRSMVINLIKEQKPRVVVLFGAEALYSVIGDRWQKNLGGIDKWRGFVIPDLELQTYIVPTYRPLFCASYKTDTMQLFLKKDLQTAITTIPLPRPQKIPEKIIYLDSDLSELNKIKSGYVVIDFETTGKKPHASGHRIVSVSVAISEETVYSFLLPKTKAARAPFIRLLHDRRIRLIAHNVKFEDNWVNVRLRTHVSNWFWDTMLTAHTIDNRPGITGLKFQTYVHLGIIGYESTVSPYLRSSGGSNSLNTVLNLIRTKKGVHDLLYYGARDSLYTFRLFKKQMHILTQPPARGNIFEPNIKWANRFFLRGTLAFAKAERVGLRIDSKYINNAKTLLTLRITDLEREFKNTVFFKDWQKTSIKPVNVNSNKSLANYLYKIKKIKPLKITASGQGSTDNEALTLLKIPELQLLLERSKLEKVRDTYLTAFEREQVRGRMHPSFNLHLVRTYRSSSADPNFQNIPKRDKDSMRIVRSAIYPREGNQLLEMDFSGIEVGVSCTYHKDANMIKYVVDSTTDMHGDMAQEIFKVKNFNRNVPTHNVLRGAAKGGFVFPQFYGDYYKNCAKNIATTHLSLPQRKWRVTDGIPFENGTIAEHLIAQGLGSYALFEKHLQRIEKDFWGRRFVEYAAWKDRIFSTYQRYGYVPTHVGFVVQGLMTKKDVTNYPVQGSAFHCLLWLFIELTAYFEKHNFKTRIVGQIHDAIVFDVAPKELYNVYNIVQNYATKKLPKAFKWINVPMSIDAELCPINGSYADKTAWTPDDLPF